jgi:hypothetical protein
MRLLTSLSRYAVIVTAVVTASGAIAAAGDPVVHVESDEPNNAAHIRASIDIAAPPAVVWGVITDCARAPHIIPNLESCRIVQHDPGGHWDIREHVVNWATLMPRVHTTVRNSYEIGRRLMFKRIGGDMRISQGEWRLEPIANAQATRLVYDGLLAPSFPVPEFMVEHAIHQDFPNMLRAIRSASVADAAKH